MKDLFLNLKPSVVFKRITKQQLKMLQTALDVWTFFGFTPTVTSANDSKHRTNSLHYTDLALDFRTKDLPPGVAGGIASQLQTSLGLGYDVVMEKDHIHTEYDNKRGR